MSVAIKNSEVTIENVPDRKVIGLRYKGHYRDMAQLFPKLYQKVMSMKDVKPAGPPMFIFHEGSEEAAMKADKEGTADIEVCAPIEGEAQSEGEFKVYQLKGGKMVKITHEGPYEEMKPTYDKFFAWLEKEGKKITGPTWEVYLNSPDEVEKEELITEVYAPVD